jgi:hypothetical protein
MITKATANIVKRCDNVPQKLRFSPNAGSAIRPSSPILMRWPWGYPTELPQIRACRLPAPASSSHEVATSAIRRRYVDMDQVSMYLACFPSTVPETAPPSFHGVPRVGSPASTVLWGAATPCRPFRHASFPSLGRYQPGVPGSSPSALDAGPWIILELFIRSSLRLLVVETAGSPKFPEEPL